MSDNPLIQVAETIQTASIKRHPSPDHDLNPSTAASYKQPVTIDSSDAAQDLISHLDDDDDDLDGTTDEVPVEILRPAPRKSQLPPLPDLRFEQSYLQSIRAATDWKGVAFITIRDQIFMPLLQGTMWTLLVCGFRHWNRAAKMSGQGIGARVRRWWWDVNNWTVPTARTAAGEEKYVEQIKEYYEVEFGGGGD